MLLHYDYFRVFTGFYYFAFEQLNLTLGHIVWAERLTLLGIYLLIRIEEYENACTPIMDRLKAMLLPRNYYLFSIGGPQPSHITGTSYRATQTCLSTYFFLFTSPTP